MPVNFSRQEKVVDIEGFKDIEKIQVRLVVRDATGKVNATDIMLQGGPTASIWTGHPAEIPWTSDD